MLQSIRLSAEELARRLRAALLAASASRASADSAVRALMHASRIGVDSHGARLVAHYDEVLRGGRVNPRPKLRVERRSSAVAIVDGDNGLGHHAAYRAAQEAVSLAREAGVGALGVIRSSHYGAAGAYALAIAEAGMVGFATTNSDSAVSLFGGAGAFHGTNPLAFAAPSGEARPWLVDMATSSVPLNRVLLYRSLGVELPEGVAADGEGTPTREAEHAAMLLPMGGTDFGFKGAALAGVATVLSAVLQGMALDHEMIPMVATSDKQTPRGMGHFLLALDPERFGGRALFEAGMRSYLHGIRNAPARAGHVVMAPGDREWSVQAERERNGIPIDPDTARFLGLPGAEAAEGRSAAI